MDIVDTLWEGSPVRIIMSHADALAKLAADGYLPPRIPEGCNTSTWYYQDRDGHQCLVANQRGFTRELQDDEEEVNGLGVFILLDPTVDLIDARAKLRRYFDFLISDEATQS